MASIKRGAIVASMLVLVAVVASACDLRYSTPPAVTNTPIGSGSLFNTSLPQPTNMNDVQNFATGTALAIQSGTPVAGAATATPLVGGSPTITPTSIIALPTNAVTTPTATLAVIATNQTGNTLVPVGSRPATYILQEGEFPYCIARRYDVDPEALLTLSGLSDGVIYPAGTQLRIPQSGSFSGDRSWHDHPATFTVGSTYDTNTVYGVACYYGDIEPSMIATQNNISVDAVLTAGQILNIP